MHITILLVNILGRKEQKRYLKIYSIILNNSFYDSIKERFIFLFSGRCKTFKLTNWFKYQAKLFMRRRRHILRYLKTLRHYEYYHNNSKTIVCKLISYYYRYRWMRLSLRYNLHIGINMVGYGLYGSFKWRSIINCKSMGNYCSINGGVIIGNKDKQSEISIIGNHVKLSVGCKVFGKVKLEIMLLLLQMQ